MPRHLHNRQPLMAPTALPILRGRLGKPIIHGPSLDTKDWKRVLLLITPGQQVQTRRASSTLGPMTTAQVALGSPWFQTFLLGRHPQTHPIRSAINKLYKWSDPRETVLSLEFFTESILVCLRVRAQSHFIFFPPTPYRICHFRWVP